MQQLPDIIITQDDVRLGIATFTESITTDILTDTFSIVVTDADNNIGNAVDDETSLLCCVRDNITGLIWELKTTAFMTTLHTTLLQLRLHLMGCARKWVMPVFWLC